MISEFQLREAVSVYPILKNGPQWATCLTMGDVNENYQCRITISSTVPSHVYCLGFIEPTCAGCTGGSYAPLMTEGGVFRGGIKSLFAIALILCQFAIDL